MTVYVPAAAYVCACVTVVDVVLGVPSPQLHTRVNASPFGSAEPALEKVHTRATHDGGLTITGTGGRLVGGSTIVTTRVAELKRPHPSVTVSVTVKVPAPAYVFDGFAVVLVVVSPKFQR